MLRVITTAGRPVRRGSGLMTMVSETPNRALVLRRNIINNYHTGASISTINFYSSSSSNIQPQNLTSPIYYSTRNFHSTSFVELSSTPPLLVDDDDTTELPPNLKFDRKSSFAPKQQQQQRKQSKPLLVVPPDAVDPISPTKDDEKIDDHIQGDIDDYIEEDDYDDDGRRRR